MTFNDYSFWASVFLLAAMAFGAAGYVAGRWVGIEEGKLIGEQEGRQERIQRVMAAKRNGMRAGRILGMKEAIRDVFGKPILPKEVGPMPTRPRKPGINHSAASATQGAQISQPSPNTLVAPYASKAI